MPNDSTNPPSAILFSSVQQGSGAAGRSRHYASVSCPHCGQPMLKRIRRRTVDRLLGLFVTLRRFQCCASRCQWEGNLVKKRGTTRTAISVAGATAIGFGAALPWLFVANELLDVLRR